jgi:hypothetical protein
MFKRIRRAILAIKVKHLFNTIDADDLWDSWVENDRNQGERNLIKAQADTLLKSKLWHYLKTDIRYKANQMMFVKGKTEDDLVAGKLWLYTLDCIETHLKNIKDG